MSAELTEAIDRAYDALVEVIDIADEMGSHDLVWVASRAQDAVNALHSHPDASA